MVKNKSGTETEKIKRNIQKIFKENKLDIVIQCDTKIVNYLDVSPNLNNSNYPPSILKQIPALTEKRISTLSSNETIFNESKNIYQKALEKSGYAQTLNYHPANEIENKMSSGLTLYLVLM